MSEYIDREAAINELNELFTICRETLPNENGKHYVVEEELCVFYNRLSNIPAADVRPVVGGEWEVEEQEVGGLYGGVSVVHLFQCSECGHDFEYATNFCPNCGAEMKEGEA